MKMSSHIKQCVANLNTNLKKWVEMYFFTVMKVVIISAAFASWNHHFLASLHAYQYQKPITLKKSFSAIINPWEFECICEHACSLTFLNFYTLAIDVRISSGKWCQMFIPWSNWTKMDFLLYKMIILDRNAK